LKSYGIPGQLVCNRLPLFLANQLCDRGSDRG
jgi:hypothetical protein